MANLHCPAGPLVAWTMHMRHDSSRDRGHEENNILNGLGAR